MGCFILASKNRALYLHNWRGWLTCHGEACDEPGREEAGVAGRHGRQQPPGRHQDVGHEEGRLAAQLVRQKSEEQAT